MPCVDLDRSLRNLALGVPGPGSVPAGLSIEAPHDPAHAFRADPLAVWSDQVSAALLPAQPVCAQIGVTVSKQPFTFYMVAAFIYLGLTVLAMIGLHFLEKRASRGFVRSAS